MVDGRVEETKEDGEDEEEHVYRRPGTGKVRSDWCKWSHVAGSVAGRSYC